MTDQADKPLSWGAEDRRIGRKKPPAPGVPTSKRVIGLKLGWRAEHRVIGPLEER